MRKSKVADRMIIGYVPTGDRLFRSYLAIVSFFTFILIVYMKLKVNLYPR